MLEILIIVISIILDQVVKGVVVANMFVGETIPLIESVFHITYVQNTGAAFSMLEGNMVFFYIITPVAVAGFGYYLWKLKRESRQSGCSLCTRLQMITIAMIVGGTIGNYIDRVLLKYVVDMFDFRLINFAVFNVADIFLTVGTFALVLILIVEIIKEAKESKEAKAEAKIEKE